MNRFALKALAKTLAAVAHTASPGRNTVRGRVAGRASLPMGSAFIVVTVLASVVWSQTAVGVTAPATDGHDLAALFGETETPYFGLDGSLARGPKQALCNHIGCPDETYHPCFSGTVTIKTPVGDISGTVTCYEPNRDGGPRPE